MSTKRTSNLEIEKTKKRARKAVTLETKLNVLRRLDNGEKITYICTALGLPKSTVQTIRDNKKKIESYSQSIKTSYCSKRTRERSSIMEQMERLLDLWMENNHQRNVPMSQIIIQQKAKSIFESLMRENPDESSQNLTFVASKGWFEKFKKRHNLHNIKLRGESASADAIAAKNYPEVLKEIIRNGGYCPEQVFNVDETGLYWKRMPDRTFISRDEKSASGYKVSKERLTLLLGGNASGDFKLKPLLVYMSENPRAFKGLDKKQLPVIWKSNKKAWMTKYLFEDWFKNYFCPEVKAYLQKKNLSHKALLLMDNAPGHPANLSEICEHVQVEYLPKNTTSLIQPMDQGVIANFKAYYLRRTLQQVINKSDDKSSMKEVWKNYTIKDAIKNISESWNEVQSTTLNRAWKSVWPECVVTSEIDIASVSEIYQNILGIAVNNGFENLNESDIVNLLNSESEPLTDEELLQLESGHNIEDTERVTPTPKELTSKQLTEALNHFEQGTRILLQFDPDEQRSAEVTRNIEKTIFCYTQLQEEHQRNVKQQTLDKFFKAVP